MAEYINKWTVVDMLTDLENQLQQYKPFNDTEREMYRKICETEIAVGKTPAADVVEVVHAEWEEIDGGYRCTNCHHAPTVGIDNEFRLTNFCPNCGADMRG